MNNKKREGNFTSSKISKLCMSNRKGDDFGVPAFTYIDEKRIESKMKRCLDVGAYSWALAWGEFMEMIVFNILGTDYVMTSKETDRHPTIKRWSGSKDYHKTKDGKMYCIGDMKCYEPKKFAQYTECLLKKDIGFMKANFPGEYWQLVSNAIINGVDYVEAITFMPKEDDMPEIRQIAENYDGPDQWKYRFIYESPISDLSVLPQSSGYESVNKFEFLVPEEDKIFLTERVEKAILLLEFEL